MASHLTFNVEAAKIVGSKNWLGSFLPFNENLLDLFLYSTNFVFTNHQISNSYNPFLWPMSIELFGSALVFCFMIIYKNLQKPLEITILAALYLFIIGSFYSLFFIGIAFAILREKSFFLKASQKSYSNLISGFLIFVVIFVDWMLFTHSSGGFADAVLPETLNVSTSPINARDLDYLSDHSFLELIKTYKDAIRIRVNIALASLVVYAIYRNTLLKSLCSSPLSEWLGKISFPLYVTHFAIIISFTSWSIIELSKRDLLTSNYSIAIIFISTGIALFVAQIFSVIERLYLIRLNTIVDNIFAPLKR